MKKIFTKGLMFGVIGLLLVSCGSETDPIVEQVVPVVEEAIEDVVLPPPVVVEEIELQDQAEAIAAPVLESADESVEVVEAEPEVEVETAETVEDGLGVDPWPRDQFGYGIHAHAVATSGQDPKIPMEIISQQLGLDWVKVQLRWSDVYPDPPAQMDPDAQWWFYDGAVDQADKNGLNLMLSVVSAPQWTRSIAEKHGPPDDYQEWARFMETLMMRYRGRVHAIELWNEQNLDREWMAPNGLNAADYVEFAQIAENVIHAIDPNVIVISGALSPTGWDDHTARNDQAFLGELVAAGLLDIVDCVGAHHNGYNLPPDVAYDATSEYSEAETSTFRGPFDNPHPSWSFYTTLNGYVDTIRAAGYDTKLCVTEFGYGSSEEYGVYPPGFEYYADNTLQEQAAFTTQAYQQMHDSGDVMLSFLFNLDLGPKGGTPDGDDNVGYSVLDKNGVPRPVFGAIAEMEKRP